MRETTCCFSGHRSNKLPWRNLESDPRCVQLKKWIREQIRAACCDGYRRFLCGMALGCDTYFCEEVLSIREYEYPQIVLEAAVPFDQQAEKWAADDRARYQKLLDSCDIVTVLRHGYAADCMERRNRYMIDQSSQLICVYDGKAGGTMNTLLYAIRQSLKIVKADLENFT